MVRSKYQDETPSYVHAANRLDKRIDALEERIKILEQKVKS